MNCIKIGLPGKSILGDYFQENRTSRRHFLLLRISFPGRPSFIQFVPELRGARNCEMDSALGFAVAIAVEEFRNASRSPSLEEEGAGSSMTDG